MGIRKNIKWNKHNAELQQAGIFIILIDLVEKKTRWIDMSHAMVISISTTPLS